ncbi:MAG: ATP-binding cassette domain-containing protein [Fidelibacterota bacterium]
MLTVSNIQKSFNYKTVLNDISFSFSNGDTVALLGKNGVGKSTLLRIIAKINAPDKGKVNFLNNNILKRKSSTRKGIYYCGHAPGLYPSLTAEENIHYFSLFYQTAPSSSLIRKTLVDYELLNAIHKPVKFYSQGMIQRLKLAFVEMIHWKLLLIDEPFTGLDISGSDFVQEKFITWQDGERVIIFVDHNLDRALGNSSRVLLIDKGKIAVDEASNTNGLMDKISSLMR